MPQTASAENNFSAGLKTEFTALNFPEHAATDTDNCIYNVKGNVTRRLGIDFETNYTARTTTTSSLSMSSYVWKNAGGDGLSMLYVTQIGSSLYFYKASSATTADPLSDRYVGTVDFSTYLVAGSALTISNAECQYSDGNGYLFVYHPYCEPFYVSFNTGTDALTSATISIQMRDFAGVPDSLDVSTRPSSLSDLHSYNLTNQGWVSTPNWAATDTASVVLCGTGLKSFTVATGLSITAGQNVRVYNVAWVYPSSPILYGVVNSYTSGTGALSINVNLVEPLVSGVTFTGAATYSGAYTGPFTLSPINTGYVGDWFTSQGNYPSNSDQWWNFKNSSGVFDPTTMVAKITQNSGYAPKGHNIFSAFNQIRGSTITTATTTYRPKTGCWFQGRVWYAGTDSSFQATSTINFTNWSEAIYFSQIVTDVSQLGMCYQTNDPTSEDLMQLLPSDGGVINIQGCGSIYKLFPIQNGLLVFAANGIWFITGSQGIGFTANDYTITKISEVQALSGNSFINVNGMPVFWNEEAIYTVEPTQQGLGLQLNPITTGTISSFYEDIPKESKKYARGSYNPIDYVIQWAFRSTMEAGISDRYYFDRILNYCTYNKSFYPYTIGTYANGAYILDIKYVDAPGGDNTYPSGFKYWTVYGASKNSLTFSEEKDTTYVDWATNSGSVNFDSYFVTGYSLKGQAQKKFQPTYVYMYSDTTLASAYTIEGIWDFADEDALGRRSVAQTIWNNLSRFGYIFRRHKIRGRGMALQIKVSSIDGLPFNIVGWSVPEQVNAGS